MYVVSCVISSLHWTNMRNLILSADIRAVNQCSFDLTVYYQSQLAGRQAVTVASGQSVQLGLPTPWPGGVIWASQDGNTNNGQATQLEFTIGPTRDSYDISLVVRPPFMILSSGM